MTSETQSETHGQPGWKQTLGAVWIAQMASFAGFSFAFPFLPFFVRELGVTSDGAVSIWVGVLGSAGAVTMAVAAPLWGALSDRVGRKIMVERAMFGAALALALMSLASSPWHLLAIRVLQGALSGTITASTTLVASVTPSRRAGFSLGLLQTASFVGLSFGPFVGGIAAELIGYRRCFIVASVMLGAGGLLVLLCARDDRAEVARTRKSARPGDAQNLRGVLTTGGFLVLLAVLIATYMTRRALGPIFPLYVEQTLPTDLKARAPSITGTLLGVGGAAAAGSAILFGWLSDRWRPSRILGGATLLGGVFLALHSWVWHVASIGALRFGAGATMGAMGTSLNAMVHRIVPRRSHGKAYGLTQSATAVGFGLGPSTGGLLGAWLGFRWPFVILGAVQFLVGVVISVWMPGKVNRRENGRRADPDGPGDGDL